MKKHRWFDYEIEQEKLVYCFECGVICTPSNENQSCPPWKSSTDEGEITKTNRAYEAGVVNDLNSIYKEVVGAKLHVDDVLIRLKQLIQKCEGLDRN